MSLKYEYLKFGNETQWKKFICSASISIPMSGGKREEKEGMNKGRKEGGRRGLGKKQGKKVGMEGGKKETRKGASRIKSPCEEQDARKHTLLEY